MAPLARSMDGRPYRTATGDRTRLVGANSLLMQYDEAARVESGMSASSPPLAQLHHAGMVDLLETGTDLAATQIQAHFRGLQTRRVRDDLSPHAAAQPMLTSVGGGYANVTAEAKAGRMAYFVLRAPHPHALLRVGFSPVNRTNALLFAKRGAPPEADEAAPFTTA